MTMPCFFLHGACERLAPCPLHVVCSCNSFLITFNLAVPTKVDIVFGHDLVFFCVQMWHAIR